MLPDGNLVLIGRADFNGQNSGFRVELNPIENSVAPASQHTRCHAQSREQSTGENARLVAYIVPRPGSTFSIGNLRSYLADSLPTT